MKKLLIILSLALVVLTGCNTENINTETNPDKTTNVEQTNEKENNNTPDTKEIDVDLKDKENNEDEENNENDADKKDEDDEEVEIEKSIEDLYNDSDYVSILRMTQTGVDGYEINIIEDFKGSLNNIILPKINGIEANKDYLVFMKDSPNGEIVPTTNESLIMIDGRDDKNVSAVREIHQSTLKVEPEKNEDNKTDKVKKNK